MDTATTEKLMADLRAVVRDAESLIGAVAAESGEQLEDAGRRAQEAAEEIDERVRRHPWAAVGVAAAAGLLIGLLLGRR
ncbi:MAG TPA: DUF883 family protein [Burkholderiales bacterium]|nr:DUF883 family protein [Burkholderiales bacterium]